VDPNFRRIYIVLTFFSIETVGVVVVEHQVYVYLYFKKIIKKDKIKMKLKLLNYDNNMFWVAFERLI
jgi:hypothetical protein